MMLPDTLVRELHSLSHSDKLRVMEMLAGELVHEEMPPFQLGVSYEVWAPQATADTIATLEQMLEAKKRAK